VILINLLPHREEKRRQRKRAFFIGLGAAAVAGLLVGLVWYSVLEQMKSAQIARNDFLKAEIARLDAQIKDIAELRNEIESLKARQRAVEDLQTNRNVPVYLLDELVKQTPEGVYLTSIKQNDNVVAVNGVAQTNERVSELLRNTLNNSKWLERPELVEIKAMNTQTGSQQGANNAPREQRRLFEFQMRVSIKRPAAPSAASAAASGAARGAAPAASGSTQGLPPGLNTPAVPPAKSA
jgi:type IV pilus assembly protein PilN